MKKVSGKIVFTIGLAIGLGLMSIVYSRISSELSIRSDSTDIYMKGVEFVSSDTSTASYPVSSLYGIGNTSNYYTDSSKDSDAASFLAKSGTCTLSDLNNRSNSQISITGTELYRSDSYVVYQINLVNLALNPMRLNSIPEVVYGGDAAQGGTLEGKVSVGFYKDANCENSLETWSTQTTSADGNFLAAATKSSGTVTPDASSGRCHWYLKVSRNLSSEELNGQITFSISSIGWSAT